MSDTPTLAEQMDQREKDLNEGLAEVEVVRKVMGTYPDLKRHVNRWHKERFSAKSANANTTDCDISHNCGCCPDSPLEVWPHLTTEGMKVYSDPLPITVGEKNQFGLGEVAYPDWEDRLKEAGISNAVIEKVRTYLEDNEPEDDEDV